MTAAEALALSELAIQKNDIILAQHYDKLVDLITKNIKMNAERGWKSANLDLRYVNREEIPGFEFQLYGPGQRTILKKLTKHFRELGYYTDNNCATSEPYLVFIRW